MVLALAFGGTGLVLPLPSMAQTRTLPTQTITVSGTVASQSGSYAGTFNLGQVTAPVPEPATWALMLVGFGAVGYSLRSRKTLRTLQAV